MKNKKLFLKRIVLLILCTVIITSIKLAPIKADNFDDYIEVNNSTLNISLDKSVNSGIKNVGENINVKYNIKLNEFMKNANEAVFLVDSSLRMRQNSDWSDNDRRQLVKEIIKNMDQYSNTFKVGIMGFSGYNAYNPGYNLYNFIADDWTKTDESKIKMYDMSNSNDVDIVHSMADRISSIEDWTSSDQVSLDPALEKTKDLLGNDGENSNRSIVIITAGQVTISQNIADEIKERGYRIILLDISSDKHYDSIGDNDYNLKNIIEYMGDSKIKKYDIDVKEATDENTSIDSGDFLSYKSFYLKVNPESINNGSNVTYSDERLYRRIKEILTGIEQGANDSEESTNYFNIENAKLRLDIGNDFVLDNIVDVTINYGVNTETINVNKNNNVLEIDLSELITYKKEGNSFVANINELQISFNAVTKTIGENISFSKDDNGKSKSYFLYKLKQGSTYTNQKIVLESPVLKVLSYDANILPIKILEVEPADSFKLTFTNESHIKTGSEENVVMMNDNGYIVEIEHISMPEFVGKIDKLNGKYDVIVIGRYVDYNNITNEKNKDQLAYRDYNLDQKIGNAFVENDITDRKANEILNFARSGQLVYVDKTIVNPEQDSFKNLKIYKNFSYQSEMDSYKTNYSINELSINTIVEEYLNSNIKKRFSFNLTSPQGDSMNDEKGDINKRNMIFTIKPLQTNSNKNKKIDINLYLDNSGDGLFQEDEIVKTLENITPSNDEINLEYKMSSDFIGYLDWKLEIVEKDNNVDKNYWVKSYYTGSIIFRSLTDEKMKINVLQISPYDQYDLKDSISGNLNLSTDGDSGNDRFKKLLRQLKDYDIKIETKSVSEINDMAEKNTLELNGKYQMIMIGFGDAFNGKDMNIKAVEKIKEFIETNQGIMLTHDTISPYFSQNISEGLIEMLGFKELDEIPSWVVENRSKYKRTIFDGSQNDVNKAQSKIVYNNNSTVVTNYPFELLEEDNYINVRRTHSQYYQLDLENENVVPAFTEISNTVGGNGTKPDYEGEIPSDIIEELNKNGKSVSDMQNDDSQYWNNSDEINQYDLKNNYYTYSIGNITFSGTGENSRENNTPYPKDELKLFVNTITKAIKSANHAPTINVSYPDEIFRDEILKITTTYLDMDNDEIKADVYIVNDNSDEKIATYDYMESGTIKDLEIDKSKYENKNVLKIKIVAEDEHGAKAEKIIEIKINKIDGPIKVEVAGAKGLVGDKLLPYVNITKNENVQVSNVKIKLNEDSIQHQLFDYNGNLQSDVNFDSSNKFNIEYELDAKGATPSGCVISVTITYEFNNQSYSITREIPIAIRDGYIKVTVNKDETIAEDINPTVCINLDRISMNNKTYIEVTKKTGDYKITLEDINNYTIKQQTPISGQLYIDYDNPIGEYECLLSEAKQTMKINHGIYKGIIEGNVEIVESTQYSNPKLFAKGSIVTFAANIEDLDTSNNIELDIDENLECISEPQIYGYKNGQLTEINNLDLQINNKKFSWKDANFGDYTNIVVIYSVKLNEYIEYSTPYINNINANGHEKPVYIGVSGNLPDLF